jgi:hypothetical protein
VNGRTPVWRDLLVGLIETNVSRSLPFAFFHFWFMEPGGDCFFSFVVSACTFPCTRDFNSEKCQEVISTVLRLQPSKTVPNLPIRSLSRASATASGRCISNSLTGVLCSRALMRSLADVRLRKWWEGEANRNCSVWQRSRARRCCRRSDGWQYGERQTNAGVADRGIVI